MSRVLNGTILACAGVLAACQSDSSPQLGVTAAPLVRADPALRVVGQYIVMFKDVAAAGLRDAAASRVALASDGSELLHRYSRVPGLAAKLTGTQLQALRNDPAVAYVEEDQVVSVGTFYASPADGIDRVDQRQGRDGLYDDSFLNGQGVDIYIIDTGINKTHQEYRDRIGNGRDFVDNDSDPTDCHGHGSHVASTAAGLQYGIAKGATLHAVRVLDCGGFGTNANVIAGIDWVADQCHRGGPLPAASNPHKRCVANMSLGGPVSTALNDAVDAAINAPAVFVVAAGNEHTDACTRSPASTARAITVGAVDDKDARAAFSNFGACVDLFAPGVTILGASIGSSTATKVLNGTSMATPHVTGVAAQYLQTHDATPAEVEAAIVDAASRNCVADSQNSPNLLLYNGFGDPGFDCTAPVVVPDSCVGACGGLSDFGCYCDEECEQFGDCCPDKQDVCIDGV